MAEERKSWMHTAPILEIIRRMERPGTGISTPSSHGYCGHCGQNEKFMEAQIRTMLRAIAAAPMSLPDAPTNGRGETA